MLVSPYDQRTHEGGNALNLTFLNILDIVVNIEDYLTIRSDHEILVTTLLSWFRVGGYKLNLNPDESYLELLRDALYECLPLAPSTY